MRKNIAREQENEIWRARGKTKEGRWVRRQSTCMLSNMSMTICILWRITWGQHPSLHHRPPSPPPPLHSHSCTPAHPVPSSSSSTSPHHHLRRHHNHNFTWFVTYSLNHSNKHFEPFRFGYPPPTTPSSAKAREKLKTKKAGQSEREAEIATDQV